MSNMNRGPQYYAASWDSGLCIPSNWVTNNFGNGEEILLFNKKALKTRLNKDNVVELYLVNPERTKEIPLTRTLQNGLIMQATIWMPKTYLGHLLDIAFQGTPFNNLPRISRDPVSMTDGYSQSISEMYYHVYFNRYIYMHTSIEFVTHKESGDMDHIRYNYCFGTDLQGDDPAIIHDDLMCVETNSNEVQYFIDRMLVSIKKILSDPAYYIPNYPEENVT